MIHHHITNWDDAYANGVNIPGGDRWPAAWVEPAKNFRDGLAAAGKASLDIAYGERPRNRFDLFMPGRPARSRHGCRRRGPSARRPA